MPVPGPLKPLIAVPTTAGTGSETTGVSIFDLTELHAKTGIASRRLKPTLGVLDPENTQTMPPEVAASSGLDVLSHAIESFTAIPYTSRPYPASPRLRPAYQGSNPISDIWALQALRIVARYLVRAVDDPSDHEARAQMMLAAAYAGVGFGNAGVHLPHGMSYPVSGHVRDFRAPGYPRDHPLIPHGISVILNAPAVFRFTAAESPSRHLHAAEALGADVTGAKDADAGTILAGWTKAAGEISPGRQATMNLTCWVFSPRHMESRMGSGRVKPIAISSESMPYSSAHWQSSNCASKGSRPDSSSVGSERRNGLPACERLQWNLRGLPETAHSAPGSAMGG